MSLIINGLIKVEPTIFPDKTSQVWKLPMDEIRETTDGNMVVITWNFESEGEFMHLAQLKFLIASTMHCDIVLDVPYLPYARQDKVIANDATFALRPFVCLLAILRFDAVLLTDPHSDVAVEMLGALGTTVHVRHPMPIQVASIPLFCYPDEGARTKYTRLYKDRDYIYGKKVRDQLTGRIEKYDLEVGDHDVRGKNVLIVDDLCDGGATFALLAKELLSRGVGEVVLFVTHGLFTKGTEVLFESGISRIFTKDGEVRR